MKFIKKYFQIVFNFLFELIFPRFCVGCNQEGTWLCSNCFQKIVTVSSQVCSGCGRLNSQGKYCLKCRKGKHLKGIISAVYFEEGPTKEIIHNFKYNSVLEFGPIFGKIMAEKLAGIPKKNLVLTFVPLHSKRLAQRGYNQAEILAKVVSSQSKIPYLDLLKKIRKTKRQVGLLGKYRRRNLSGVFKSICKDSIKGKKIIIVDDIVTTGTTLNECARILKEADAKEVWGLVAARG